MIGWAWTWWGWLLMTLAMLGFWGAVLWFLADVGRASGGGRPDHSPEQVLADRLARGEIDVDEYRDRVDALDRHGVAGGR